MSTEMGIQHGMLGGRNYGTGAQPISFEAEAGVFFRLRLRMTLTSMRQTFFASRLRLALILLLTVIFWLGIFSLFFEGFRFLGSFLGGSGDLYPRTVRFIFDAFFASLMVMLFFSLAIIFYGAVFRSRETDFLLTLPVSDERLVLYKFQESLFFSSWGFILLGSPMLVAYGLAAGSAWYYYALMVPFMLAFVVIPGAAGAVACLLIVHWLPRLRLIAILLIGVLIAGAMTLLVRAAVGGTDHEILTAGWFEEMLSRLEFSWVRLSPSWWLSTGLLEAALPTQARVGATHPLAESVKFFGLLVSNALVAQLLVAAIGKRVLRSSYSGMRGAGRVRFGVGRILSVGTKRLPGNGAQGKPSVRPAAEMHDRVSWIDRLAWRLTAWMPRQVRLLMIKDLRVFRRDPVQWSQFLIFFGLLALYFVNIRKFSYGDANPGWLNMVSFLNLAVVGLILSTFTTRFVFPMISLEGSRFWILGLLPVRRDAILWGKFFFAAFGALIPCTLLVLLSDLMLRIGNLILIVHQLACIVLCFGLAGIAVGLGAKMPDLREQSPSKIAAGFGGTLNLVLSAVYILAIVVMTALPCHFYSAAQANPGANFAIDPADLLHWIYFGTGGALFLGLNATLVPLVIGLRAFRRMEF